MERESGVWLEGTCGEGKQNERRELGLGEVSEVGNGCGECEKTTAEG